jgi:uncharacterized protein (TIGR02246 family)
MNILIRCALLMSVALPGLVSPSDELAEVVDAKARTVQEVEAFLVHFGETFKALDPDEIRTLYVGDGRFVWHEDGALRYSGVEAILEALAGMSPGMSFETIYSDTHVEPLGEGHASLHTSFETSITSAGSVIYSYAGVITMVLERAEAEWRIVTGHTSTRRERGR